MAAQRWVLAYECDSERCTVPAGIPIEIGETISVGREADVTVGIDLPDTRISRSALEVTATADGWMLNVTNRNGAVLSPWGQPPLPVTGSLTVEWPLVAIRLLGDADLQHWVLLEAPQLNLHSEGALTPADPRGETTVSLPPPRPLTDSQQATIRLLFADMLRWPPVARAEALQLKQVARRLDRSVEAVQARLRPALQRAYALGLARQLPPTDPEYLYVLVRGGYVTPDHGRPMRHYRRGDTVDLAGSGDAADVADLGDGSVPTSVIP